LSRRGRGREIGSSANGSAQGRTETFGRDAASKGEKFGKERAGVSGRTAKRGSERIHLKKTKEKS